MLHAVTYLNMRCTNWFAVHYCDQTFGELSFYLRSQYVNKYTKYTRWCSSRNQSKFVSADWDSFRQNWIISLFKSVHTTTKPFNSRIMRHSKKQVIQCHDYLYICTKTELCKRLISKLA